MKTIGNFKIYLNGPYPIKCTVKCKESQIVFHHWDLPDLEHAVRELKRQALMKECE